MATEDAYLLADEDAGLLGGVRAQSRRERRRRYALCGAAALCTVAALGRGGGLSYWSLFPSALAPMTR